MEHIGVGPVGLEGRTPRLAGMLRAVSADIADWDQIQQDEEHASDASTICSVMDFTLALADELLRTARSLTIDIIALLRAWAADPATIINIAGRPEWLLDGWEQIVLLWNDAAGNFGKRAALAEIAGMLPTLPREANDWSRGGREAPGAPRFARITTSAHEGGRLTTTTFDLIARNERFRAVSLRTPWRVDALDRTQPVLSDLAPVQG